ncbi:hypothetical protein PR048_008172 [Dryococelus australis]|uniref:Uncharacterized protein n=1 Tax=Dryococelus australis TaxID=614101 RepID=A0ABQ9HWG0_9NEOP|nr:hypothetical protein PR048_008172 [Dryococelus australis]
MRVIEVNMVRRRDGGGGGDPRENLLTNGIVRHDSHLRKSDDPTRGLNPVRLGGSVVLILVIVVRVVLTVVHVVLLVVHVVLIVVHVVLIVVRIVLIVELIVVLIFLHAMHVGVYFDGCTFSHCGKISCKTVLSLWKDLQKILPCSATYERTTCTKSPFHTINHCNNGKIQFMHGDVLKNHIKNCQGSSFENQQVMSSIPPTASIVFRSVRREQCACEPGIKPTGKQYRLRKTKLRVVSSRGRYGVTLIYRGNWSCVDSRPSYHPPPIARVSQAQAGGIGFSVHLCRSIFLSLEKKPNLPRVGPALTRKSIRGSRAAVDIGRLVPVRGKIKEVYVGGGESRCSGGEEGATTPTPFSARVIPLRCAGALNNTHTRTLRVDNLASVGQGIPAIGAFKGLLTKKRDLSRICSRGVPHNVYHHDLSIAEHVWLSAWYWQHDSLHTDDGSQFCQDTDDRRVRVKRRPGQRCDPRFIVERHTAPTRRVMV